MNNIRFCTASSFLSLPDVRHGFTCRTGGVSEAPYDSLNLGLHVSDNATTIQSNRCLATQSLGFSLARMVCAEQVHRANVTIVTEAEAGRGATDHTTALPQTDSLVTSTPGLLLGLYFADCLPVFFADLNHKAVGIAHAGWRGLHGGVLENTIQTMREAFGTSPTDLLAYIGPGIGPCCFEVGPEVAAHFEVDAQLVNGKPHVDLPQAARRQLGKAGIPATQIEVSRDCTSCLPEYFFSHRRDTKDKGQTGRMGGFIGLIR